MESQVDITNLRRVIHKIQSEQRVDSIENVAKGMFAIALVLCLLIFSNLLISAADVAKYLLLFFNGVIIAVFLNTLGVLIHESQHGALTNTKFWNNFWGRAFSAFLIFPYFTGKKFHLEHHRFEREREKDPENLFHDKSFWHAFLTGHNEYTRIHWVRMFNYIKQSKNINDKKRSHNRFDLVPRWSSFFYFFCFNFRA